MAEASGEQGSSTPSPYLLGMGGMYVPPSVISPPSGFRAVQSQHPTSLVRLERVCNVIEYTDM
jgi:hypothetical protein